jgi:Uma2 family endonuclease
MSTAERPKTRTLPSLVSGQHLDQPTFHERYEAMPPDTWAELVGGIVYMPSPMRLDHGGTSRTVSGWLFYYQLHTSGIQGADAATVKLDSEGEPQPDCQLFIPAELGGHCHIDAGGYLVGPPELVVEIARSSRDYDLGVKKDDYERAGVREYVVVELDPNRVHWFIRRDNRFDELLPVADGVFRSEVFPGLWLDPQALFAADLDHLVAVLNDGLATPQHAAFVAQLAQARKRSRQSPG